MRLRQLEIVHAVYEHGSISAAARALGVSQPSVSKTLRHAEDSMGFRLFQLSRGRLIPTDEAHALMHEAGDVFERLGTLQQTARNLAHSGGGHIRLGVVPSLALDVLPRALARFRRDWPSVTFEVHTHHHDDLLHSLIARELDLAIAFSPPPHPRLSFETLAEGELVVMFPKGMFPDTAPRFALDQLADRDVIGVTATGPVGAVLTEAARLRGIDFRETISVQTFFIAARLAQLEQGVTVIDEFTARAFERADFVHRPTEPPLRLSVSWVTLEERQPSRAAQAFLRVLADVLNAGAGNSTP